MSAVPLNLTNIQLNIVRTGSVGSPLNCFEFDGKRPRSDGNLIGSNFIVAVVSKNWDDSSENSVELIPVVGSIQFQTFTIRLDFLWLFNLNHS